MIRLLGDFLFFVSQILGILLIIGLIKPSLVSNIMKRLPDPIGEFFEKVNNRKKILLVYGVSCLLLMIIGPTLSPVEHFETGKKYYEKEDWAGAVRNLSKVSTDDENYAEALKLLVVAKENRTREQAEETFEEATREFENNNFDKVIDLLSLFPKDHSLTNQADELLTNAKEKKFDEDAEEILSEANKKLIKDDWDKAIEMLSDFPKDHRLFTEANSILTRAIGRKVQNNFTQTWSDLEKKRTSSDTKARKSHFLSMVNNHLNEKKVIKNWYGKILEVGDDYVTVEHNGIKYYLYPKGKGVNYIDFDRNMKLLFSGRLNGLYFWDTTSEPGLYVDCTSISNVDNTNSYFLITDSEMVKYLDDIAKKEQLNKDLGNAWKDLKNALEEGMDEINKELNNQKKNN